MAIIRTLVVDDEKLARERLKHLLAPFTDVEVVGEAENGEEALEKVSRLRPELVLLDIQMPGCSGIEVAASLASEMPRIVFCTAYDRFAIEAFELHALDYLLKPVSRSRLSKALDRVRSGVFEAGAVEKAVHEVPPSRFLGKKGNRYRVIPVEEALYFYAEGGLTQLCTREQSYWMEPSLSDLEKRLKSVGFCRISRQAVVSLNAVTELIPLIGGHGQVRLSNGKVLEVSRRRLRRLMKRLQGE